MAASGFFRWRAIQGDLTKIYSNGLLLFPKKPEQTFKIKMDSRMYVYSKKMLHSQAMHRHYAELGSFYHVCDPFDLNSLHTRSAEDTFKEIVLMCYEPLPLWNSRDIRKKVFAAHCWSRIILKEGGKRILELLSALSAIQQNPSR